MLLPKEYLTAELLIEALEENKGFILAAARYLQKNHGLKVDSGYIKKMCEEWGMNDWLLSIRKGLAEECMRKTMQKGIVEGDNQCLFWVLNKYGHHVDYLDSRDENSEAKQGWQEILAYVKGPPKSDTDTEHPGKHSAD